MSPSQLSRRTLTLAAAGWTVAARWAKAADGPAEHYAVLSIIGDRINVLTFRPTVGSNLDQNDRRVIPIPAPALDNTALLVIEEALKKSNLSITTTLLASRDPKLFALQGRTVESPGDAAEAIANIKAMLVQTKATRLILVSPRRTDAEFRMHEGLVGSGKVSGLGFYVDRAMRVKMIESGETGEGFLAPYASFSLSLVDAATMTTIRSKAVLEHEVFATAGSKNAVVPWDTLTSEKKVEMLQSLIRRGIERALPELLAGV